MAVNAFPEGTHISGKHITVTDKKCNFSDMCSRERVSLGIYVRGHVYPGETHITVTPVSL